MATQRKLVKFSLADQYGNEKNGVTSPTPAKFIADVYPETTIEEIEKLIPSAELTNWDIRHLLKGLTIMGRDHLIYEVRITQVN